MRIIELDGRIVRVPGPQAETSIAQLSVVRSLVAVDQDVVCWPDHGAIGTIMMEVRVEDLDVLGTIRDGLGVCAGDIHTGLVIVPGFNAGNYQVVNEAKRIRIELVIPSASIDAVPRTIVHLEILKADVAHC